MKTASIGGVNVDTFREAQARVGQSATLTKGILRGRVKAEAYRTSYGRLEYLVRSEAGDRAWVREKSLTWEN